jgi:hypothetical protein
VQETLGDEGTLTFEPRELEWKCVWIAEICISTRKWEERKKEEICYNQRILLIKEDLVQTIIHNVRRQLTNLSDFLRFFKN